MGTLLGKQIGAYKINKLLGKGGMGEVYLATDEHLDRYAALKVLKPELSSDENFIKRFTQEAKTLAQLNHPHIATLYTVLKDQGQYIMAMEYIDGTPFDEYLKEKGPLTTAETLPIIIAVLDGLQHAHEKGIVHRDLKPSNIMFNKSGTVKVMDFGIARGQKDDRQTKTGMIIGTLDYMAPELIKGEEASYASDLYAIGIMLYQVLSNKFPFSTTSEYSLMQAHIQTKPTPIQQHTPQLSKALIRYINKLLQKQPQKRFASTEEALLQLRQINEALKPAAVTGSHAAMGPTAAAASWQLMLKEHWQKIAFAASILLLLGIGFSQLKGGSGAAQVASFEEEDAQVNTQNFTPSTFETPLATAEKSGSQGMDKSQQVGQLIQQGNDLAQQKNYLGDYPSLFLVAKQILDQDAKNGNALAWVEEIIQHYFVFGKRAYDTNNSAELNQATDVLINIAAGDNRTNELKGLLEKLLSKNKTAQRKKKSTNNRQSTTTTKEPTRVVQSQRPKREEVYQPPSKPRERVVEQEQQVPVVPSKPKTAGTEVSVKSGQVIRLKILEEVNTTMPLKIGQRISFALAEPLRDADASLQSGFKINAKIIKYRANNKKAMVEIKISSIRGPNGKVLWVKKGSIARNASEKNETITIRKGSIFEVFAARNVTFGNR